MKYNIETLNEKQLNDLIQFLTKLEYPSTAISKKIDIEKLSSEISEKCEKTISQGQVKAIIRRILKFPLTSTERSQLYELRQKIQRYERFLNYFGEWGYKYDYQLKIILMGLNDKQSEILSKTFAKPKIAPERNVIGASFYTKLIENFDKSLTNLQIWDISNNKRFETIRAQYYKGATAVIFVFDKSKLDSFNSVKKSYEDLKNATQLKCIMKSGKKKEINIPLVLIGMGELRDISLEEILSTAKQFKAQYFDIEDLYDKKFQEAFFYIAYQVLLRISN